MAALMNNPMFMAGLGALSNMGAKRDIGGGYMANDYGAMLRGGLAAAQGAAQRTLIDRQRKEDRDLDNERYMRSYMENKLARLAQDKRYEENIARQDRYRTEDLARQGQYRIEDLAHRDIENLNRRNDAALAMEREDKRDAARLAMEARRAELAEIEAMNRSNNAMLGFDAEQRRNAAEALMKERRFNEIEKPLAEARIREIDTPPLYRGMAMSPSLPHGDSSSKFTYTDEEWLSAVDELARDGERNPSNTQIRAQILRGRSGTARTEKETLGDPNAKFFPALRGMLPERGN
jgi:hypothetical protein